MTEDLFEPAWARVDRSNELRKTMADIWNDFIDRHPYTPILTPQGDGVYILSVIEEEPAPLELAVATGEWLYNVRSALDYTLWATAAHMSGQIPPPSEGQIQYPIYDSEAAWSQNLYRLKPLAEHHVAMLRTMQPFNSDLDANYLGWINRLARIDRHRHLNHMSAYLAEVEPVLAIPGGCVATLEWGERVVRNGRAEVARITVEPWDEKLELQVNPRIGIDPEIEAWSGSEFWKKIHYSERFLMLQIFVGAEIAVYEYDCTGRSRESDALTTEYRDECDLRRTAAIQHPRRIRPATEWSQPIPGNPATNASLKGNDFPAQGPGDPHRRALRA